MTSPCYLCGAPSTKDGLCERCYNSEHPLAAISSPLKITVCKKCGAVKVPGGWQTLNSHSPTDQKEEQIDILLQMELKVFHPNLSVEIIEENKLDRVLLVRLLITGKSAPELNVHTEELPVEIRYSYATCDTCSMASGGYYEAILQVRAEGRTLTEDEKERILEIARARTASEYGKDSRAFILQVDDTKFGLDMYMGSELLCKKVADEIESLFLAERKENFKLYSQERGGKRKYRITILLRLPEFQIGDFIEIDGYPCQVLRMGKGGLTCYELPTRNRFTITPKSPKWRTINFIAGGDAKRKFTVVSNTYGQPVQVMDSETYSIFELESSELDTFASGDTIYLLEFKDALYLVPEHLD